MSAQHRRIPQEHGASPQNGRSGSRRKRLVIFIAVVAAVSLLAVAVAGGFTLYRISQEEAAAVARAEHDPQPEVADTESELVDNPIDFATLQQENPDIYAWISIPGADVNQPVLQSGEDDLYYLNRDRDGNSSSVGSVFSQSMNAKDFSDPVTVLYGHDIDPIFKSLHKFEDEAFFDANKDLQIYLPDKVLTYEIVAVYQYDDRHILNSFDFSDRQVLQGYYDEVLSANSSLSHVRSGVTLDAEKDKILQLSTCMLNEFHGSHRFIVTAVLRGEQETRS